MAAKKPTTSLNRVANASKSQAAVPLKESVATPDLETQKIHAEIAELGRRWWLPSTIQAVPSAILAAFSMWIALGSGFLDQRKDFLAAQNERLTTQKIHLEAEQKLTEDKLSTLNSDLEKAQTDIKGYKQDLQAIEEIRNLIKASEIEFIPDRHEYRIRLKPPADEWRAMRVPEPEVHAAVIAAGRLRSVSTLQISSFELEPEAIDYLKTFQHVKELILDGNWLNDDSMSRFPVLKSVQILTITQQKLKNTDFLIRWHRLKSINLGHNSISDSGLRGILSSKDTLTKLVLDGNDLTDGVLATLSRLPNLQEVSLAGNKLTQKGFAELVTLPNIRRVFVSMDQITPDQIKLIEDSHPEIKIHMKSIVVDWGKVM